MLSPVEYYDRYHAITVPSFDGPRDRARGIRVDHYRLGAQQAFIDERFRLGHKIQKDLRIRRQEKPAGRRRGQCARASRAAAPRESRTRISM